MISRRLRNAAALGLRGLILLSLAGLVACSGAQEESARPEIDPALVDQIPPDAEIATDIEIGIKGGQLITATAGELKTFNDPIAEDASSSLVTQSSTYFRSISRYLSCRIPATSSICRCEEPMAAHSSLARMMSSAVATASRIPAKSITLRRSNS